ncbi:hypothetical protein [Dongia sp.]|uniref:hypothetical protein n=1 Tax=Dongia sp. TaxID=1977262 RepID=UPI003750D547
MTMLAATISATGAVLSQDSWIVQASAEYQRHAEQAGGVTRDPADTGGAYGHATDPNAVNIVGHGLKIIPVPRFGLAIATTGPLRLALFWGLELMNPAVTSLEQLRRDGARRFAEIRDQQAPGEEAAIVHAGFDPARGTGFGFVSSTDGTCQDIAVGETIGLAPDLEDPGHGRIAQLWSAAARGWQIEELHRALFEQQRRAFLAGKLGPGVAIGGQLHHVEVTRAGIMIATAPRVAMEQEAA